jgi:hypothetical protein
MRRASLSAAHVENAGIYAPSLSRTDDILEREPREGITKASAWLDLSDFNICVVPSRCLLPNAM